MCAFLDIVHEPVLSHEASQSHHWWSVWWTRSCRGLLHLRTITNDGQIHRKTEVITAILTTAVLLLLVLLTLVLCSFLKGKRLWSVLMLLLSLICFILVLCPFLIRHFTQ